MKTLAACSLLGAMFGISQPMFANALNMDPLSWPAQLGVVGASLSLVGVVLLRTIPKMAAETRQGLKEAAEITAKSLDSLGNKMDSVRDAVQRGTESNLELLTDVLKDKRD